MFHWASTAVAAAVALSLPTAPIDGPVVTIDGSMVITRSRVTLQSDVLFAFDSARLSPAARRRIADAAREVARRRPRSVVVEGFTDSRGGAAYNLRLSQRRAEAVERALPGITANAVGRGEGAPVASNATAGGRELNRRVEIRFR